MGDLVTVVTHMAPDYVQTMPTIFVWTCARNEEWEMRVSGQKQNRNVRMKFLLLGV